MTRLHRLLDWARVTDDDGRLSLTHMALGVALYCTVRGVQVSWTEWAAVVVTLGAYQAKRVLVKGPETVGPSVETVKAIESRVATMERDLSGFKSAQVMKNLR